MNVHFMYNIKCTYVSDIKIKDKLPNGTFEIEEKRIVSPMIT